MTKAPLSDDELDHLRDLMVADKRRQWAVSVVRNAAIWLAAVSGGYFALKAMISELFK